MHLIALYLARPTHQQSVSGEGEREEKTRSFLSCLFFYEISEEKYLFFKGQNAR